MSIDFPSDLEPGVKDWRLRFSVGVTIIWLLLGFTYISGVVGWTDFVRQNAPSLGSFLEGAFAPLAFLWLVVGFFLQQKQLTENTRTFRCSWRRCDGPPSRRRSSPGPSPRMSFTRGRTRSCGWWRW